jgi:hypothetical protein
VLGSNDNATAVAQSQPLLRNCPSEIKKASDVVKFPAQNCNDWLSAGHAETPGRKIAL